MSIFGSSYPPGCSGTPYDNDYPCEVCGETEDNCICPECPVCGEVGNPDCYIEHGMILSDEQKKRQEERDKREYMQACLER